MAPVAPAPRRGPNLALIVLIIVLVAVLGVGAWFVFGPDSDDGTAAPTEQPSESAAATELPPAPTLEANPTEAETTEPAPTEPAAPTGEVVPLGDTGQAGDTTYVVNSVTTSSEAISSFTPTGVFVVVNVTVTYIGTETSIPMLFTPVLVKLLDSQGNSHYTAAASVVYADGFIVETLGRNTPVTGNIVFDVDPSVLPGSTLSAGDPIYRADPTILDLGL